MALPLFSPRRFLPCSKTISRWPSTRFYSVRAEKGAETHRRYPGPPGHTISTLNPPFIAPDDYVDLSQRKQIQLRFPKSQGNARAELIYGRCSNIPQPFPPRSAGFFYYHRDPDAAPLEGSIRFRVTSDNAPSSFNRGHDLLLPSGLPWQIILPQVACGKSYGRLRDQLLEENLVTAKQLLQCRDIFREIKRIFPRVVLFRMNQEFPVEFTGQIALAVVGKVLHRPHWSSLFRQGTSFPITGSGVARFEPSTDPEYAGRRVVHLRITKIVNPVSITEETTLLKPEAGQLLVRPSHSRIEPWAYDIDASNSVAATALRALWDNSRIP
ncbi:hypothetical protein DFH08DRAFT_886154 [Mycena albidolilacea]|uniref:Uncharacterized protein n=1 Tax=Mycena albidolilacea TaxID=1033008 RepID=A0AAD6ZJQ8_9AGAR|nr:hypothetical protein DFH08DRAFT_886154 [Mycena albidolilacea]